MLTQLTIRQFALIDHAVINFHAGLTVLTGETGAGKSIVVDAVNAVLGGRADKDMIRSGSARAAVEGVFSIGQDQDLLRTLREQELLDDEGIVTLSRELHDSGRTVCRVNGTLVSLQVLRAVSARLMEIHGQHDHQALLNEGAHLGFLDMLGEEQHATLCTETATAYEALKDSEEALHQAEAGLLTREKKLAALQKQEAEIAKAELVPGEEEELVRQKERLQSADRIYRALSGAYALLYDTESDALPALFAIKQAAQEMQPVSGFSDAYLDIHKRLQSLYYELEDVCFSIRAENDALDMDGYALEKVESRLDILRRLQKKYGTSIADVIAHLQRVRDEIAACEAMDETVERLREKRDTCLSAYRKAAEQLRQSRRNLAAAMEKTMETQLDQLNMKGAKFYVEIERLDRPSPAGLEKIRFLIAPNRGEEKKPLSKTASGGELSRIMLAIKCVASDKTLVPSAVFDEIDTGISGETAEVVAEKMWQIAKNRQVICVTHLQQIAAMASTHCMVEKHEEDGRTATSVTELDQAQRVQEIARLIGGSPVILESGLAHAKALLSHAEAYRGNTSRLAAEGQEGL